MARLGAALAALLLAGCGTPTPAPRVAVRPAGLPAAEAPPPPSGNHVRPGWLAEHDRPTMDPPRPPFTRWAIIRVESAASATVRDHTLRLRVSLEGVSNRCPGQPVTLGVAWQQEATGSRSGDPAVLVARDRLCVPVADETGLQAAAGLEARERPASFDVLNGERWQGADPDDLAAAGAVLQVPAVRGQYRIAAYGLSGSLATDDEEPFPVAVLAVFADWRTRPLPEERAFLRARAPDGSQFNVALRLAPRRAAEPATPGVAGQPVAAVPGAVDGVVEEDAK